MTLAERIAQKTMPEPNSGCYLWLGAVDKDGYARIAVDGRNRRASIVVYEEAHGPVPDGLCVCHHCDIRSCVNDDHFFLGTHAENMADMKRKGRLVLPVRGDHKGDTRVGRTGTPKISEADAAAIRSAPYPRGARTMLAARYGISPRQVQRIRSGRRSARG